MLAGLGPRHLFIEVLEQVTKLTESARRESRRRSCNRRLRTTLLFNGCPIGHIKELLGHERLDTTCRYYLGVDLRAAKEAHRRFLRYD